MNKILRNSLCFIFGVCIGLGISYLIDSPDALMVEQARYCEMVELHRADPTVGWPDFNDSYESECTNENAAR